MYPSYTELDPYRMSACSIDTAIRNIIAAGGNPNQLALLDNFCWCSSNETGRLGQLKLAAKACYDYSVGFGTPFISGKDSMFNDFKGYDRHGNEIKISIPPTLLVSSIGLIDEINKAISLDSKFPGDLIYILGETNDEMGGSEYFALNNLQKGVVPFADTTKNKKLYQSYYSAAQKNLIASGISIQRGGLGIALAKTAIGGMHGIDISLKNLPGSTMREDFALYSESQGRFIVTVDPKHKKEFEAEMKGNIISEIGKITSNQTIKIAGKNVNTIVNIDLNKATEHYRKTFKDY
jgi:phosphoribosylformylglycinamidine synthase